MNYKDKNRIEAMRGYRTLLEKIKQGKIGMSPVELTFFRQYLINSYGKDEVIQAENEVERRQEHGDS